MTFLRLTLVTFLTLSFNALQARPGTLACPLFEKEETRAKGKFKSYLDLSLTEGSHSLDPNWIVIVEAILKVNPKEFQSLIPKELIDPVKNHEGENFDHKNSLNRRFEDGFLVDTTKHHKNPISKPKLYHMTDAETAALILDSQKLLLSQGSKNYAAICLGAGGFPAYQNTSADSVILEVKVKSTARILDLTYTVGDLPGSYSRRPAYEWYLDEFVPALIKGKYDKEFPDLSAAVKRVKKSLRDDALSKIETFALLMGADLVKLTEKYELVPVNEYWIVNPTIVSEVKRAW